MSELSKPTTASTAVRVDPAVSTTADASLAAVNAEQTARQAYNQEVERIRATRKPFGSLTQKLALAERPNYHRHWFNDVPGRIDEKKAQGWTHITDDKGKPTRRVVGSGRDKGALYAYAMEIPLIFWEEDCQAKVDRNRAVLDDIKKSPIKAKSGTSQPSDREKFYSPREITIEKK